MVDNMKKFILFFLIFILLGNNVGAQYVRKVKEPNFFIPYNDRMHKPEVLQKIKNNEKSVSKTGKIKNKNKLSFNKNPEYKNIYDNYIKEINNYLLYKKFDENNLLDTDLSEMSEGNVFEVNDDVSTSIETQEQYDFYMLAKNILEN